jgi:hypothetical protein
MFLHPLLILLTLVDPGVKRGQNDLISAPSLGTAARTDREFDFQLFAEPIHPIFLPVRESRRIAAGDSRSFGIVMKNRLAIIAPVDDVIDESVGDRA